MTAIGIHQRTRRRIQKRGAALVEASVVIPVLVIFLGLMMYTRASYAEKMRQQNSTRENSLYFASHSCQGAGGSFGAADHAFDADENQDATDIIGKKGDQSTQAATSRTMNMASSTMAKTVSASGHARSIKSESHVYCNERPYDGNIGGWASFAFTFFRTGLL